MNKDLPNADQRYGEEHATACGVDLNIYPWKFHNCIYESQFRKPYYDYFVFTDIMYHNLPRTDI